MSEDNDRIEQIRARRSRINRPGMAGNDGYSQAMQQRTVGTSAAGVSQVSSVKPQQTTGSIMGVDNGTPWLRDRVSLSLEAQIALVETRSTYKLTLADMGYHNRQNIISIKPGIFLRVEPTGCYRMSYHNRM